MLKLIFLISSFLAVVAADFTRWNGKWAAPYENCHCTSLLAIEVTGNTLNATKVTGTPYVPAGKISFTVQLDSSGNSGTGFGRTAQKGFQNPEWNPIAFNATGANSFAIQSVGSGHFGTLNAIRWSPVCQEGECASLFSSK